MKDMFEEFKWMCRKIRMYIHNTWNHIRWRLVCDDLNYGRKRILRGGIWIDEDNNVYNVRGDHVGWIEWNERFEGH